MTKKRILFVDDEVNLLNGLKRVLRPMHREWDMVFVDSAWKALDLFDKQSFHVVVSDIRMPGMNGLQLLTKVMKLYPKTVRVALSGEADGDVLMEAAKLSHQYIGKPCDIDALKATISSGSALIDVLSRIPEIGSLPMVVEELIAALNSPHSDAELIGEILSKDIAMTAKILQLVNSAFLGVPSHVSSTSRAVSLIGYERVKHLLIGTGIFSKLDSENIPLDFVTNLWEHSMQTGTLAKIIARREAAAAKIADNAFLAGLLHDLGKLVLASAFPVRYRSIITATQKNGTSFFESEQEILGITHSEVGVYVARLWGLPPSIVDVIGFHHGPLNGLEMRFNPLAAVHVANALEHEHEVGGRTADSSIDFKYLASLGKSKEIPVWRKLYLETFALEDGETAKPGKRQRTT